MSLDVNARPESTGGIRSSGSAWVMRLNNSLPLGLPAVMIAWPGAPVSSRRSALRLAASGPWHSKQFSERIGRTSRLNGTDSRATTELAKSHPTSSSTRKNELFQEKAKRRKRVSPARRLAKRLHPHPAYVHLLPEGEGAPLLRSC